MRSASIRVLLPARRELEEAFAWYGGQATGLGERFRAEVVHGMRRIRDFPDAWHPMVAGIRRYRLGRFPYGILYAADGEQILILAISHLHRHPEHWRDRLPAQD